MVRPELWAGVWIERKKLEEGGAKLGKKGSRLKPSNSFHRVAMVSAITFFLLLSVNPPLHAWYGGAHREISNQALNFLPDPLKKALNPHYFRLLAGVDDPDINRVDDHKLYLYNYR